MKSNMMADEEFMPQKDEVSRGKESLRKKLIRLFLVTSTIPILAMSLFSFYNMSITLKENSESLRIKNLEQVGNNLHISLVAYEDLLYQMYTDDTVVQLVDKLNRNVDLAVTVNQLRRYIQSLLYTKNYIRSISIITSEGRVITYDQLTQVTIENSWLKNYSMSPEELYDNVSADNKTHVLPLEYGTTFANEDFYLLHLAHRIIDYKDLTKQSGIVVISLDEAFLQSVCAELDNSETHPENYCFIVDENGRVISFPDQKHLEAKIVDIAANQEERLAMYERFIREQRGGDDRYISILMYHDNELGWDIVNVSNQKATEQKLFSQFQVLLSVSILSAMVAVLLTLILSRNLSESIRQVVATMRKASSGDMTARVQVHKAMPLEIESIAHQFNDMIEQLDRSVQNEKVAGNRQRIAEVKALEAQINPHFLYNTLDTINWMAIERDEFEISNAISSLAAILRYAITNSNEMVYIKDEIEWLKKYIYLQQKRLIQEFQCHVEVSPELLSCKIYKQLLQPFVENAIIHGLKDASGEAVLTVSFSGDGDMIHIIVRDNGKGMPPLLVDELNRRESNFGNHIGLENVLSRLKIYYGDKANVFFRSELGVGTEAHIIIPGGAQT